MTAKRKWIIAILAVCLVLLAVGTVVYKLSHHRAQYEVTEERLFDLGSAYNVKCGSPGETKNYFISEDGGHIALELNANNGGTAILWDDTVGRTYKEISDLTISPDGQRYAYTAYDGGKKLAVIDGTEGKKYDDVMGHAWNSGIISYYGNPGYCFSPDSKNIAYVAIDNDKRFVVYNGTEFEKYNQVWAMAFSRDSKNFIYWAAGGTERGCFFIRNGKKYGEMVISISYPPIYTPNAEPIIYDVVAKKICAIVVTENGKQQYSNARHLTLSSDGKHLAYQIDVDKKATVIWDGKKGNIFDSIDPRFNFSPNNQRLAYIAMNGKKSCVVVDNNNVGPEYDLIWPVFNTDRYGKSNDGLSEQIKFSPDSKHFVYVGANGQKGIVVRDGKESKGYTSITDWDSNDSNSKNHSRSPFVRPAFSPDSQHLVYVAKDKTGEFAVLDDKELRKGFGHVSWPTFSPDSKHLAYVVTQYGDKLEIFLHQVISKVGFTKYQFIVIDEQAGPAYSWVSAPAFRADGTLVYYAIRDNVLYRVTKKP